MNSKIKVNASILCADFSRLGEEIKRSEQAGCDMFHVDVMDGHFVPNITIGPLIVRAIRPLTKCPIDSHLMIENPGLYIDAFIDAGSDILSIHAECYGVRTNGQKPQEFPKEIQTLDADKARADILRIKKRGKKAFLVLNPGTPMCLAPVLKDLDGVLIMSVNPGFAKQKFMNEVLDKVRELKKTFPGDIAIDGGINDITAPEAVKAGANVLITASYFYGAKDPAQAVRLLKSLK